VDAEVIMSLSAQLLGEVYQANFTLKWLSVPLVVLVLLLLPLVIFRRHRLGYAAALSFLMFTALAIDWPLTMSWGQHLICFLPVEVKDVNFRWMMTEYIISAGHGGVMFAHDVMPQTDNPASGIQWPHIFMLVDPYPHYPVRALVPFRGAGSSFTSFYHWGFRMAWGTQPPLRPQGYSATEVETVTVPIWFLMLLCVPLPLLWLRRFRRRRYRLRHGLCLSCGYDLRKSPEKCPECGAGKPSQVPASRPTAVTKSECP
jgi:hypothetical protein